MSKEFERFVLCPPLLHAGIGYNLFSIENQKIKTTANQIKGLNAREKQSWHEKVHNIRRADL